MAGRKSASLSALFSDACKRLDIPTEQAMGCERVGATLRLYVTKDNRVDFYLIEDEESGQLVLGEQMGRQDTTN